MVALDAVVRILLRVVKRRRDELIDRSPQSWRSVGHDLHRCVVCVEHSREEPSCRSGVAPRGDVDVDDLAVLVDGAVDVPPPAGDLDVGLVHEPTITNAVTAGPCGIREQRREPLHPPVHGDVVELDPTLGQEFLDVAV